MSAYNARRQFEDNVQHFSDTPEKQNLYKGLTNLAIELERVSAQLHRIEQTTEDLKRRVQ